MTEDNVVLTNIDRAKQLRSEAMHDLTVQLVRWCVRHGGRAAPADGAGEATAIAVRQHITTAGR